MLDTAQDLLEAARLADAVKAQTEEVRAHPTDPERRYVLFALLCFAGDIERANRQLEALAVGQVPGVEMRSLLCRGLLAAEAERREVWAGRAKPLLAPDAPASLGKRVDALSRIAAGDPVGAARLLEEAADEAVLVAGTLNGEPFEQIRDTDDVAASVLEVFAQGRCLWLSFEQLKRLEIPKPEGLLDLIFAPARLHDRRGHEALVHLPVLYAGTHEQEDGPLRLGRVTEWSEMAGVGLRGVGQKVLLTVQGGAERECGLLDLRALEVAG
jgi:type VI secretion system protein ImpE